MRKQMKSVVDEAQPSLNEVYGKLSRLQEEFASLLRTANSVNPEKCDEVASQVRSFLNQSRVFVLSARVDEALERMDRVRNEMERLRLLIF